MKRPTHFLMFVLIVLLSLSAVADVRLPAVISDNMVLQQKSKVAIWGWADPGEKVTVKGDWQWPWGPTTRADESGKWLVKLATPKAGGPHTVRVIGNKEITLNNVLIGEVWVASGQSNMQWPMTHVENAEMEIATADYPEIRLFQVALDYSTQPEEDCQGSWKACSPETIPGFSAVAYFYGRHLHRELNVPIGLIHTSWGGTPAEAWTSAETLSTMPDFAETVASLAATDCEYPGHPLTPEEAAKAPCNQVSPTVLYNAMIHPLVPYGIAGVIWYQGESNSGKPLQYRELFPALIQDWRAHWDIGDFSFYYVQIAPFEYSTLTPWASFALREAQMMAMSVPNTGMAVTMDIGDETDIHPRNKQDVGMRLALWALAKDYGRKDLVYSGPIYQSMEVEGEIISYDRTTNTRKRKGHIRLYFDYTGSGLVAKGGELTHFQIAGHDRKFVPAQARIEGDTVVVWSDQVDDPVAVRYAWSNWAQPNLYNADGLPASSFRTDNWPDDVADRY